MKIKSENIEIAFFVDLELNDIKGHNERLNFIQMQRGFVNDRIKYLESELLDLQCDIEALDEMKNEIDVDLIDFHDIESIDDIPDFVANSSESIQEQCDDLLAMYNEYLESDDLEITRMLLELRPRLEAFATFDKNGIGSIRTLINFEEYIELNLMDSLSNLFDYVEKVNKEPVVSPI